jgi:4-amino-4-deoxy-L-arabinose transferase-like glycosyltransferase
LRNSRIEPVGFGFAAHATHFVVVAALAGSLLLLKAIENKKPFMYFLSGVMFGLAPVMKQPGLFFLLFGFAYTVYLHIFQNRDDFRKDLNKLFLFIAGALLPLCAIGLWMYFSGVFDKFWFWTVAYAGEYGTRIPCLKLFSGF